MNPAARRLIKLHDIFLYVSIFISFLAVITAYSTPLWLTLGFPVGMVGAHLFYRSGRAKPSHNRWWNALILAVAALSLFDYLFNTLIDVMAIGVRFVLVLTLIKLFSRQGPRDEFQLYALSFLTLAGASALSEQFFFGIYFGLYVLTGTFALALLHLKTEAQKSLPLDALRHSPFDRLYATILATISLMIFASSLLVFFAFPRIGLGFFADPARSSIPISGFSDTIDFGAHGSVRDNPTVVMRVEFEDGPPDDYAGYRWRVMAFDEFDGQSWNRTDRRSERRLSHGLNRNYDLRSLYTGPMRRELGDEAIQMEIYLEPLGRNVVPTIWPTTNLRMGAADTPRMLNHATAFLKTDGYGDLHHSLSGDIGLSYQITVATPPSPQTILGAQGQPLSPAEEKRYLQLPDVDPRVSDLAVDLTEGASGNYEKAEVVGQYLTTSYDYTLDLPELEGSDPVAEFLFDHREGHCEYFATTAAVLLRSAGVPTRVVNGFLGGDWNDVGEYLTVRQGDAHAWIEVYVPDMGWVPYDPTPAIESSFLDRSGLGRFLSDSADALRHGWTRWFLEYDLRRQVRFFRDIADALSPASDDDDHRREGSRTDEEDDDEGQTVPLRIIVFLGGWLVLVGTSYIRGRTYRDVTHWRFAAGLTLGVVAGAAWVGWFQGYQWWWTTTGAVSVFVASAIPAWQRRARLPSDLRLATALFDGIERRATRRDLARRPGEGPGTYLERLAGEKPTAAAQLRVFRKLYLEARFGRRQLDDAHRDKLKQSARAVRSAL